MGDLSLFLLNNYRSMSSKSALCVIPFYIQYFIRWFLDILYVIDSELFEFIGLLHIVIPDILWLTLNPLEIVCWGMDDIKKVCIILFISLPILTFIDAKGYRDTRVICLSGFPHTLMSDMNDYRDWYV